MILIHDISYKVIVLLILLTGQIYHLVVQQEEKRTIQSADICILGRRGSVTNNGNRIRGNEISQSRGNILFEICRHRSSL